MQHKHLPISPCALKFDQGAGEFSGYASTFGGVDSYGDTILPGAFADTLQDRERPVRMRWNHYGPVIGRWLELREDDVGLFVRGALTPGHSVADDVYASMRHKAVDGMSIGFYDVGSTENQHGGKNISRIDLIEISPVEEPADLGAMVGNVKAATESLGEVESLKEMERYLRETGYSKSAACALVSRIKFLALGEPAQQKQQSDSVVDVTGLSWPAIKLLSQHMQEVSK